MIYKQAIGSAEAQLVYGTPMDQREPGQRLQNAINQCEFVADDQYALCTTLVFSDAYGLALLKLDGSQQLQEVSVTGIVHTGQGELQSFEHLKDSLYAIEYIILMALPGCIKGTFDWETSHHAPDPCVVWSTATC